MDSVAGINPLVTPPRLENDDLILVVGRDYRKSLTQNQISHSKDDSTEVIDLTDQGASVFALNHRSLNNESSSSRRGSLIVCSANQVALPAIIV